MKQAWKLIEADAYDKVRTRPVTVVRGKPTRSDYIVWRRELEITASAIDISDTYAWTVDGTGNNYGCLFEVMDDNDYIQRTGINATVITKPVERPHYDPNINATTPTYQRKQMEEEHEQKKHDFFTWKGAARGLAENLRDAMEIQYYSELEHTIVGYKNVKVLQHLEHLSEKWTTMNSKEKRKIKEDYYKAWDVAGGVALSAFTKALDDNKIGLAHHNITIEEEDMMEHYVEQMYQSKVFSKTDMKAWQAHSVADRDDWGVMKKYFNNKMAEINQHNDNTAGDDAGTRFGSSANVLDEEKLADIGDEIREYIQQIAQQKEKENVPPPPPNIKPADEVTKRMDRLEALINNMCNNFNNNNNNNGGGNNNNNSNGSGNNNGNGKKPRVPYDPTAPYEKYRNMGGYCFTCGFHPVGTTHTSETCGYKRKDHVDSATWTNRGAGSKLWPTKVREDQKTHASYAGKSAPTN